MSILSHRADGLKPSPTLAIQAKAKSMQAQGINVISFGAGEPDFDTPANINGTATVYNLLGKEIIFETVTGGKLNKINVPFPTGYYVVRVVSSGNVTTQKVFIN